MNQSLSLDVSPVNLEIVRAVLQRHVPNAEVWAFGSRVTGKAKAYSDLDLCIDAGQALGLDVGSALAEGFAESDLPWKVDIVDWHTTSDAFRKLIEQNRLLISG